MIACVSLFGLEPVTGTILGTSTGAVTNFTLGRIFIFRARGVAVAGQALRYAFAAMVSLLLNAAGEWLLVRAGLQYVLARVITSTVVGIGWNFPMHRWFVFHERSPELERATQESRS
jgi:putative flippase GtrA